MTTNLHCIVCIPQSNVTYNHLKNNADANKDDQSGQVRIALFKGSPSRKSLSRLGNIFITHTNMKDRSSITHKCERFVIIHTDIKHRLLSHRKRKPQFFKLCTVQKNILQKKIDIKLITTWRVTFSWPVFAARIATSNIPFGNDKC